MKNTALTQFRDTGTLYLSAPEAAELVRRLGLPHCLQHMAQHIRADFLRWADFDKTARVAAHSKDGVIELMPVADDHRYSFKYVNGHPGNTRFGMSTVMAFGVLADVDTGAPLFLSELTLTTALRTAAMSALAAQTLARPDSRVMALIGNGAQSEFQALAFQHLVGIEELRVYDVDPAASAKLVANLQGSGLHITVCQSTAEAASGADIVTTVTADKTCATILSAEMLAPGMHINAVGGDCPGKTELSADVLRAAKVADGAHCLRAQGAAHGAVPAAARCSTAASWLAARRSPDRLRLTGPGSPLNRWIVPQWLSDLGLSYHGNPARWPGNGQLDAVRRGQEFVCDIGDAQDLTGKAPAGLVPLLQDGVQRSLESSLGPRVSVQRGRIRP